jgi:hypothetical protein
MTKGLVLKTPGVGISQLPAFASPMRSRKGRVVISGRITGMSAFTQPPKIAPACIEGATAVTDKVAGISAVVRETFVTEDN